MRGTDEATGSLFSYVDLEERIPARHRLRMIRQVVNDALASLEAEFDRLHAAGARPSIGPERLVRASLLQIPGVSEPLCIRPPVRSRTDRPRPPMGLQRSSNSAARNATGPKDAPRAN